MEDGSFFVQKELLFQGSVLLSDYPLFPIYLSEMDNLHSASPINVLLKFIGLV